MSMLRSALKSLEKCPLQAPGVLSKVGELFRPQQCSNMQNSYIHQATNSGAMSYRYVIKDKSTNRNLNNWAMPSVTRKLAENKYVLRRASLEKKKCFERIETIQKQCGVGRKKNSVIPCTSYDPEIPTLWMRVKNMYNSTGLFVHPRPYVDRLFE